MRFKLLIAVLVAVVVSFVAVGVATATLPLTQSQPFRAVCEAQGGGFFAVSSSLIICEKRGFPAFTPTQLAVQQTLCERVYVASFRVLAISNPPLGSDTATICSTD
ncbi:MAG: hypothetical protein V7645_2127 [Actinomycetota bacterium]|jgi:hypothetical protein